MVYSNVLVQQVFQLLVLVVQLACLVYQLLTTLQQIVVLAQRFIEDLPNPECSVREDLSHLLPILLPFSGYQILLLSLRKLLQRSFRGSL